MLLMRILIDLPQDVLEKLEKLAQKDGRKRKNLIEKIILDYINKKP
jgi:metal-responsive CopG/Arc/MetJ family transcriptional regulator